jgi:hypothetical protein
MTQGLRRLHCVGHETIQDQATLIIEKQEQLFSKTGTCKPATMGSFAVALEHRSIPS